MEDFKYEGYSMYVILMWGKRVQVKITWLFRELCMEWGLWINCI